jgi:lantibiotic biosynthesis protein
MASAVRPSLKEFDLVHGLTGFGAYLLRRDPGGCLVRQVLAYLVQLTEPVAAGDEAGLAAPGWWTSDNPSGHPAAGFRGGHTDLGMAHGISGPLALLALAARAGVTVDSHAEAVERICRWLDTWRHEGPAGAWWPERVTSGDLRGGHSTQIGPARPSWCYGTPGIARAQQLAALALRDTARQDAAELALVQCLTDATQLARIIDPAICHGWAGVVATACAAADDARTPVISAHLPQLLDALIDHADDPLPDGLPGLIDGRAGIALTLHTVAAGGTTGWQTCLLIN